MGHTPNSEFKILWDSTCSKYFLEHSSEYADRVSHKLPVMLCHFSFPLYRFHFLFLSPSRLIFYLKFSILLLFSHPFLTFFSLSSLWNWFLTCAVVVQGPPGLPGLKGDPGSKGEKVGVGTYYCACLHGGFISPYMKWADKQTYKQGKELWSVIFVQVRCANSSSQSHKFDNFATD